MIPPPAGEAMFAVPKAKLPGARVPIANVQVPKPSISRPSIPGGGGPGQLRSSGKIRLGQREKTVVAVIVGLAIIASLIGVIIFLPTARIELSLKTAPLLVDEKMIIKAQADSQSNEVPGTAFFREVTVDGSSPVQSTEVIGSKAAGEVYLVNRSFDEQKIKENSRLVTKDDQLFYMKQAVTIPAATSGGLARVPVTVEAAEAGEAGNIEAQRLDFAALPEAAQALVYAEADKPLDGGRGDEVKVIKDADLEAAKKTAGQQARDQVEQEIRDQLPKGWTIMEESWTVDLESFDTEAKTDSRQETVSYQARAAVHVFGYEGAKLENKLKDALTARLDEQYMLFPGPISYTKSVENIDWEVGEADISARVTHTTVPKISLDVLREKLAGRSKSETKQYLEGLTGVQSAQIDLWPFWVNVVPRIANRINIDLQPDRQP